MSTFCPNPNTNENLNIITKWGKRYYKVGQLFVITKWAAFCYYRVRQPFVLEEVLIKVLTVKSKFICQVCLYVCVKSVHVKSVCIKSVCIKLNSSLTSSVAIQLLQH